MKKCPKCKTVYVDGSETCRFCNVKLIDMDEPEGKENGKGIVSVIIYTFIFIAFIMGLYFLASLLIK